MANEIVERVAIAIRSKLEFCDGCEPGDVEDAARAAIAAMREPTEAMMVAAEATNEGGGYTDHGSIERDFYDPETVWQAMIDAALKD